MELKTRDPQELYARWLDAGARIAFAISLVSLFLYLSGALAPLVAPQALPELWKLPVGQYLERAGAPSGWAWVAFIGYSDYLNLVGVSLFALLSVSCYLRVIPAFLQRGERLQAGLAIAQVVVLLAAASGLLAGAPRL